MGRTRGGALAAAKGEDVDLLKVQSSREGAGPGSRRRGEVSTRGRRKRDNNRARQGAAAEGTWREGASERASKREMRSMSALSESTHTRDSVGRLASSNSEGWEGQSRQKRGEREREGRGRARDAEPVLAVASGDLGGPSRRDRLTDVCERRSACWVMAGGRGGEGWRKRRARGKRGKRRMLFKGEEGQLREGRG